MQCKKCGNSFPNNITVNGKVRNLQNRKYCLVCSPFDKHNTAKLENRTNPHTCNDCGRIMNRKNERGKKCWACTNKESRKNKLSRVMRLTGNACWLCGYDKGWAMLDLHHIDPATKLFTLSVRELQYAWEKVETELRKCALLCCRCHREVHYGLITQETIRNIWTEKWARAPKL